MSTLAAVCFFLATCLAQPGAAQNCSACSKPNQCNKQSVPGVGEYEWTQLTDDRWAKWTIPAIFMLVEQPGGSKEFDTVANQSLQTFCTCIHGAGSSFCAEPTLYMLKDVVPAGTIKALLIDQGLGKDGFFKCKNPPSSTLCNDLFTASCVGSQCASMRPTSPPPSPGPPGTTYVTSGSLAQRWLLPAVSVVSHVLVTLQWGH